MTGWMPMDSSVYRRSFLGVMGSSAKVFASYSRKRPFVRLAAPRN